MNGQLGVIKHRQPLILLGRLRIGLVSTGRRRIAGGLLHRTARFVGATFKEQSLPERPRLRLRPLSASHRGVSETLTGNGT